VRSEEEFVVRREERGVRSPCGLVFSEDSEDSEKL
jgi:hypothetical protein